MDWSQAVLMTRITFPFAWAISLAALASAALNSVRVFGLPASASIFLNLSLVASGGIAWYLGSAEPAIYLAVGFLLGGVLQFVIQIPALVRRGLPLGFRPDFNHPGIRRVWSLLVPVIAGAGVIQINIVVGLIFASRSEGWVSALFFAERLTGFVMGVSVLSIATVVLPLMSKQAAEQRMEAMADTLGFALRNAGFVVIPGAVGLMLFSVPVVRVLYEHAAFDDVSTGLTAWPLLFYAAGLPALAAVRLITQGFFAVKNPRTPLKGAIVALVANVILCFMLVGPLGQGGLALATVIATYLNLLVLWLFRQELGDVGERRLLISLGKASLAAAVMAGACWWLRGTALLNVSAGFLQAAAGLFAAILGGVLVYLGVSWLLRAEEIREFVYLLSGRTLPEGSLGLQAARSTSAGAE